MSVSRRKDGRWLVAYKDNGRWRQRAFRDEAEARCFDSEMGNAANQDSRLTLGELAIAYFSARPDFHVKTKSNIVKFLANGCGAFLRDKYAECLSRQDLELMRQCFYRRGTSNVTINKYQAYIRAMLVWGVDNDLIAYNPWRDYKRLKTVKPIIQPQLVDLRRLYPYLPEYLQWAVKTAFCLALRPGKVELLDLTWDSFNWQRGLVVIRQGKSGRLKTVVAPTWYLVEARQRFEVDMANGVPWVIHRGKGQRVLSFKDAWQKACRLAGVKMRPYDIRHLSATTMLEKGADLAAVSAQMGHASVAITGAVYAHTTEGSQSIAAGKLPEIDKPK